MIIDQAIRDRALDPTNSFIVQAPAGSGKTELLTQRFLTLLTTVKEPEEILAVTFTRKAASEMRQRIIQSFAQKTSKVAQQVAACNEKYEWELLENPNRLKIMTIDALCSMMVHQMPILSASGGKYEITQEPAILYEKAVEKCFLMASKEDHWYEALKTVLIHFDNKMDKVKGILALLLSKREQWLIYLAAFQQSGDQLQEYLRQPLERITQRYLQQVFECFSSADREFLYSILQYAGKNATAHDIDHPVQQWAYEKHFIEPKVEKIDQWKALAQVLLTKENQWRKQFIKTTGFLSPSTTRDKEEKWLRKQSIENMLGWMESIHENETLRQGLKELILLPSVHSLQESFPVLQALGGLLPILVGFLRLECKEKAKVDFTEVTLRAWEALGESLTPSELALRLDYQFKHILIDEYQDTSVIQYLLFEKLVAGWEKEAGRTLFLVGDPMQSIYRFRGAEVSLFERTKRQGLGGVSLAPLQLVSNFRSHEKIVEWINQRFSKIFPTESNDLQGAISYLAAQATKQESESEITLHSLAEGTPQEEYIADLVQAWQAKHSGESLAILVRSRSHLTRLVPLLKSRHIPFIAHEAEYLATRLHVRDLINLIQATTDRSDRLSWLALLRSPLVGLKLADLLIIAQGDPTRNIFEILQEETIFQAISQDARDQLTPFMEKMIYWLKHRQRATLTHWMRSLWEILGGFAYYANVSFIKDIDIIFYWLGEYEKGGVLYDREGFKTKIETLYADVMLLDQVSLPSIEIMTIHKAKGLEFDTVIIPHCQASIRRSEAALLLWQEITHSEGIDLLFAAGRSSLGYSEPLYDYIHYLHKEKEHNEAARLFYVAVSRAKKYLHLVGEQIKNSGSFWEMLSNAGEELETSFAGKSEKEEDMPRVKGNLKRLKNTWRLPSDFAECLEANIRNTSIKSNLPDRSEPIFRIMGTVFHRAMQWDLFSKDPDRQSQILEKMLRQLGMDKAHIAQAITLIFQGWEKICQDPHGQWILDPSHTERKREWALSARMPYGIENIIIDYAFVDQKNVRWIIDYKFVQIKDFSEEAEREKYRDQINQYIRIVSLLEKREVKGALYFPLQQKLVAVDKEVYPA